MGLLARLKHTNYSLEATGTVIAAVSGKKLRVYAIKVVCSAALTVNFRSGASTALEGGQAYPANGGVVEHVPPPAWLMETAVGESLDLVISGTGTAAGRVSYWEE